MKSNMFSIHQKNLVKLFKKGDLPLPKLLEKKASRYMALSIVFLLISILGFIIASNWVNKLQITLLPLFISFFLFFDGLFFKNKISNEGCDLYTGVCISHQEAFATRFLKKNKVSNLLIETKGGIIDIPITNKSFIIPIGAEVLIYVPSNSSPYTDKDGFFHFQKIYGFEMIKS